MNNFEMVVTSVVSAIGGTALVVGALAAWLGQVWKARLERLEGASMQIDVDLRQRRIDAYQLLWGITALLPRWPRDETVTYEQIRGFSVQLKDWYFQEGGMYLSTSSREAYTGLQDVLIKFAGAEYSGVLRAKPTDDYEAVREKCSALRSCLAADIQSRRESPDKK